MAYRSNHIEKFIEKVNKEAEEAAQKVFNNHETKLQSMIENQVLKGQKLFIGMGSASISDKTKELPYDYAEKFLNAVAGTQFHDNNVLAGFYIKDIDKY